MISVVIPTLNSADTLEDCLSTLVPAVLSGVLRRTVVVDGGSTDATCEVAQACGVDVITSATGRGSQLGAGATHLLGSQAPSDWLLFIHADTKLQKGWEAAAMAFIAGATSSEAGFFGLRFDDNNWKARVVEAGVFWRCALLNLPYGDQGLLISRRFYDAIGGYESIPLFEDVDIVRKINNAGKLSRLKPIALTSSERYRRDGYFRRVVKNFRCLTSYFKGVPPEKILKQYQ